MVLHVARGQLVRVLALELAEQVLRHLAEHVDQHVEAAAVRHADHDLLHAVRAGALDQLVDATGSGSRRPRSEKRFWPT